VKSVTLSSYYNFTSGYGEVLRFLIENLPQNGYNIIPRTYSIISSEFLQCFENSKNLDPNLLDFSLLSLTNDLGSSNMFLQMDFSRPRILYTMWESTRINDMMIEVMNKYKHVCVPNHYNKNNFINQGLKCPIEVIPLFCDTNIYTYRSHEFRDRFVFGISNEDPRKNLDKLTMCFLKAFKNVKNVELHVKTCSGLSNRFFDSRIVYNSNKVSKEHLRDWYCNLDVYVSGATCEGWGMMQQESMCCGRPLIFTNYGGLTEYCNNTNGFEVKFKEVYSTKQWGEYAGKWSEFDEDDLINKMVYCYNNRNEVKEKGFIASKDASLFTEERFINNIVNILNLYI
jgi:glycosyltransferase involved in cell wall biosynthesis